MRKRLRCFGVGSIGCRDHVGLVFYRPSGRPILASKIESPDWDVDNHQFFAFVGFLIVRYRTRLITGLATRWLQWRGAETHLGERVLIVGAGEMAQLAASFFRQGEPGKVLKIIGMVDDDSKKIGVRFDGNKVIGCSEDIPQLVERWNIGVILFAIGNIPLESAQESSNFAVRQGTHCLNADLLEMISGCLFTPYVLTEQVVSENWDGSVRSGSGEVVYGIRIAGLASECSITYAPAQVRNALAAHLVNDHELKS